MSNQAIRTLRVEKPIYGGAFLARDEGKAVFVPMTLPGETVDVRIVEEKRGYANAELVRIGERAPERVEPRCRHFGACGGCHYQHTDYTTQISFKQAILRETLERNGVKAPDAIEVLSAEPWRYRNRMRLAFDSSGRLGYRGRKSHDVVPVAECPIAGEMLTEALLLFPEARSIAGAGLQAREVSLFCDAEEQSILATLYVETESTLRLEQLASVWRKRIPALSGMTLATMPAPGKPERTLAHWGARSLHYRAAGNAYRVDHGTFFQVNRRLVNALVECVTAGHSGRLAWDLYAGVGLFARQLATAFDHVLAVESAPESTDALSANLLGTRAQAIPVPTLKFLRGSLAHERPDLIVADPPRTGLGADTVTLLNGVAAGQLVYVSCDPATLARDLRDLLAGGYAIERMTLVDLFPQTYHLETVVELRHS